MRTDGTLGEVLSSIDEDQAVGAGLPDIPSDDIPACGAWPLCDRQRMPPFLICDDMFADVLIRILLWSLKFTAAIPCVGNACVFKHCVPANGVCTGEYHRP
jgi:hypothetical protein